jgi:hypothetical protein
LPAVEVLVDANEDFGADGRAAVAGLVEVGDVAETLDRGGEDAQNPVVVRIVNALTARGGGANGGVLRGWVWTSELEGDDAAEVGDD